MSPRSAAHHHGLNLPRLCGEGLRYLVLFWARAALFPSHAKSSKSTAEQHTRIHPPVPLEFTLSLSCKGQPDVGSSLRDRSDSRCGAEMSSIMADFFGSFFLGSVCCAHPFFPRENNKPRRILSLDESKTQNTPTRAAFSAG